jgi:hypothetical protein
MKRTYLKRKTPLKSRLKGIKSRKVKRKVKSPTRVLKDRLWALCRDITRSRYGNTCYTCEKTGLSGGNWQTAHFITSSTCSTELRYSLENLRPQCYHCNINLSGNWVEYEKRLLKDGVDVEKLKRRNQETKGKQYNQIWLENKIEEYKKLL